MWHVENELLSQPEISLVLMAWDIQWRVLPPPPSPSSHITLHLSLYSSFLSVQTLHISVTNNIMNIPCFLKHKLKGLITNANGGRTEMMDIKKMIDKIYTNLSK